MKKLFAVIVSLVCAGAIAYAGTATLNYNSSGSSPIRMTTDGSSNNLPNNTIWDSAAGANGLGITSNNAAKIEGVGTAGSAAGNILTVQGVASMTPVLVTLSGTNNINNISGTVSLPTGAATSALQGTNTATTAHTCSTGGFSELGCLGQIDDDIKGSVAAGTNTIGNVNGAPNVTASDCSVSITSGGTAQNAITAGATLHGFQICNIDSSAGSGENVWFSMTTTAAANTTQSYPLIPLATNQAPGCYSTPFGLGFNGNLSVIAATTGHKISCTKW